MTKEPKLDVKKAVKELNDAAKAAQSQLSSMGSLHQFPMASECLDKNGELTKVLIVNTDADGILGLLLELGQPYSFSVDPDTPADERLKKDNRKFARFFAEMVNVDLSDKQVLRAVGYGAIASAREVADGFFMLQLVCAVNAGLETGS